MVRKDSQALNGRCRIRTRTGRLIFCLPSLPQNGSINPQWSFLIDAIPQLTMPGRTTEIEYRRC